jgi:hypothetical protein
MVEPLHEVEVAAPVRTGRMCVFELYMNDKQLLSTPIPIFEIKNLNNIFIVSMIQIRNPSTPKSTAIMTMSGKFT